MSKEKSAPRDLAIWGAVRRSWSLIVFFILSLSIYSHAMHKKGETYLKLERHLLALQAHQAQLQEESEDLQLQIASQSDPAWIQLTLMKGLGVVPEGQRKVYFHKEQDR